MMDSIKCGWIILWIPSLVFSQDLEYAKSVVETLASPEMHGRGYVAQGDGLAADFIESEFAQIGLEKIGEGFQQTFKIEVNTLPGNLSLKINGKPLVPGKDYLVDPGSPSLNGKFKTVSIYPEDLLDNRWTPKLLGSTGKFLVINPPVPLSDEERTKISDILNFVKYHPEIPAEGTIILTDQKLTWHSSITQNPKPSIIINAGLAPSDISKVGIDIESKFLSQYETQNVIGLIVGDRSDSTIVFTAHYDHLGRMGQETYFPGANDNASGVAMLLNLAKHYSQNKPRFNTLFIAFGGEELGLLGSKHFVENAPVDIKRIKLLVNFDISGTGDEGIQIVNGSVYKRQFDIISKINDKHRYLPQVKIRGEACNSDHCMFHAMGYPVFSYIP